MTKDFMLPEDASRMADAILDLAQELWVVTERNRILEALLVQKGQLADGELEHFEPDSKLQEQLEEERRRFTRRLLQTLTGDESGPREDEPASPHDSFT